MAGIFKAYDIRGLADKDLTEEIATNIGRAFVTLLKCKKVVVGRDIRTHSEKFFKALAAGITQEGADIIDIGLCSTPMSYYANGFLNADASIMITASHNPSEWNGFKLCRAQAVPISDQTGIKDIEKIVQDKAFSGVSAGSGKISSYDIAAEYKEHVKKQADLKRSVKIAADFANAMGILEAKAISDIIEIDPLFETLDGSFPNHEANPLKTETLHALQEKVKTAKYDFGVAFDGDADRVGFVDERGEIIPMDMITALIAKSILAKTKGNILYDLRSSWAVKEVITENGGTPHMCRVGHAFIKQQMRQLDAVFAGELSGHYYFRENYFTESSAMAVLAIANLVSASEKPLSELIKPLRRYHKGPEINSEVKDVQAVFRRLRQHYHGAKVIELDGLTMEFKDWWFNVRASNTEPLVRLNVEAKTELLLKQRTNELLREIRRK